MGCQRVREPPLQSGHESRTGSQGSTQVLGICAFLGISLIYLVKLIICIIHDMDVKFHSLEMTMQPHTEQKQDFIEPSHM